MTSRGRGSFGIVLVLIVALLGSSVSRSLVIRQRQDLDRKRGVSTSRSTNLNNLNSFALGLLLGGLRGPLVMALWTSSESQKTQRDLEDFDTKVELIRLLQPEFDTVHIFQIWNKAYNISAQMANVPNKYTTILDAIEYGFSVDRERPNDINILGQIADLYSEKLGNAAEKGYYSPRLQDETLPAQPRVRVTYPPSINEKVLHAARLAGATDFSLIPHEASADGSKLFITLREPAANVLKANLNDPAIEYAPRPAATERIDAAGRRSQHDSLLDDNYRILPAFTASRTEQDVGSEIDNSSQLPYLKQFEPFPYGVSPWALSYNYAKRSVWLQVNRGAHHVQVTERIISARVPLAMEKWAAEEWHAAERAEIALANRPAPPENVVMAAVAQDLLLDSGIPNCPLFDEAIFRFDRASSSASKSIEEYNAHLKTYPADELTYGSHMSEQLARQHATAADAAYLRAMRAKGDERNHWATVAQDEYSQAATLLARYSLRYLTGEEQMVGLVPNDLRKLRRMDMTDPARFGDAEVAPAFARLRAMHRAANDDLGTSEDVLELGMQVDRCYARLRNLAMARINAASAGGTPATTLPATNPSPQ